MIKPFSHPSDDQIESAYYDGSHARPGRDNPYLLDGEGVEANLLAWAWDMGKRERAECGQLKQFNEQFPDPRARSKFFGGAA